MANYQNSYYQFSQNNNKIIFYKLMLGKNHHCLLFFQLAIFVLGRLLDDLSWYDLEIFNQIVVFQSLSTACMIICPILMIVRKKEIDGIWWILFLRSQLAFFIPWALVISTVIIYFVTFNCKPQMPESDLTYFYLVYNECCINGLQIMLTNLNYSLVCNTKADYIQFYIYEACLFGQIINIGHLLLHFINILPEIPKDHTIVLLTLLISNQILMMDLIFRAAYQDRERVEAKEQAMVGYYRQTFQRVTSRFSRNIELSKSFSLKN